MRIPANLIVSCVLSCASPAVQQGHCSHAASRPFRRIKSPQADERRACCLARLAQGKTMLAKVMHGCPESFPTRCLRRIPNQMHQRSFLRSTQQPCLSVIPAPGNCEGVWGKTSSTSEPAQSRASGLAIPASWLQLSSLSPGKSHHVSFSLVRNAATYEWFLLATCWSYVAPMQAPWDFHCAKLAHYLPLLPGAWRRSAPLLASSDEVDAMLGRRTGQEHDAVTTMKTVFMQMWDGFVTQQEANVVVRLQLDSPFAQRPAAQLSYIGRVLEELNGCLAPFPPCSMQGPGCYQQAVGS